MTTMNDPEGDQSGHPLLPLLEQLAEAVAEIQSQHSAARMVLRAVAETHPAREALLARLGAFAEVREATDLYQPTSDASAARIQTLLAEWRQWIERAP